MGTVSVLFTSYDYSGLEIFIPIINTQLELYLAAKQCQQYIQLQTKF